MQFGVQFFPCVKPEEKSAADYFRDSLEIASSIPISPASLNGWLNTGSTAPVTSRMFCVCAATAERKTIGAGPE